MILESREAYDIRPFVSGFGDTPGETVTVTFAHGSYPTTVGKDGTWDVQMNCCDAMEDQVLSVVGAKTNLTYTNVACGQVFVCSGQRCVPSLIPACLVGCRGGCGWVGVGHSGGMWRGAILLLNASIEGSSR